MRVKGPESEPPAHPTLVLARRHLRRWDLELACSGEQHWIQTMGSKKRVWLIIPDGAGVIFEEIP